MNGGDGGAGEARSQEAYRENAITDAQNGIQGTFGANFTPAFYDKQRSDYLDFAKPQLNDQYADARKQLIFSLDRSGTLNSTARTTQEAQLGKLYGQNSQTISDQALGYENDSKSNVANAESGLLSGVAQTGNVGASVNAANNQAAVLTQPAVYSPLGQMFSGFTSALQQQAGLEQLNSIAGSGVGQPQIGVYNTGLFGGARNVSSY